MSEKDQTVEKMADLIFTLRQRCASKDQYFGNKLGITTAEFNCLTHFFHTDSMGVKELARKLDITPGGVTRIITSLEEKGIIERRISPHDRREIDVYLTEKGKDIIRQIKQASMEVHSEIVNKINPEHRQAIINAIEQLIQAIDHWLETHRNSAA